MKTILPIIAWLTILFAGCAGPKQAYRHGQMDLAVRRAIKKIRTGHARDKHIIILEKAFNQANDADYRRLQLLLDDSDAAKWDEINELAQRIYDRQEAVRPYLPIRIRSEHRKADLHFHRVRELMLKSKEKAAEYYYRQANELLKQARRGDHKAARRAYRYLDRIGGYYSDYRDVAQLKEEAHRLGTVHAILSITNETPVILPASFADDVLRRLPGRINTFWTRFYLDPKKRKYDYKVRIRITDVARTPEREIHDHYVEEKEIEVPEDHTVSTDSATLVKPKKIIVKADVYTVKQHKSVILTAMVEVINLKTGDRLLGREVTAEEVFSNISARYEGDKRALSAKTKRFLHNHPRPFPSDRDMLRRAARVLGPHIRKTISDNIHILEAE